MSGNNSDDLKAILLRQRKGLEEQMAAIDLVLETVGGGTPVAAPLPPPERPASELATPVTAEPVIDLRLYATATELTEAMRAFATPGTLPSAHGAQRLPPYWRQRQVLGVAATVGKPFRSADLLLAAAAIEGRTIDLGATMHRMVKTGLLSIRAHGEYEVTEVGQRAAKNPDKVFWIGALQAESLDKNRRVPGVSGSAALRYMVRKGGRVHYSELERELGISRSAVSQMARKLRDADLIARVARGTHEATREGRETVRLAREGKRQLVQERS